MKKKILCILPPKCKNAFGYHLHNVSMTFSLCIFVRIIIACIESQYCRMLLLCHLTFILYTILIVCVSHKNLSVNRLH